MPLLPGFRRALSLALLASAVNNAHDVITTKLTWSREVSRIFYRRCIACHREGGSAFPLTSYEQARPWAQAIKEEVLSRRMPPWFAVKGFGEFKNDAGLSQEEISLISAWVEGGAPKGEENLLPELPDLSKRPRTAVPRISGSVQVTGILTLRRNVTLAGLRPVKLEEGASLRVIAERPDGAMEPLIWIHNYNPGFPQTYYFQLPVKLPSGSIIRANPPTGASISLLLTSAPKRGL